MYEAVVTTIDMSRSLGSRIVGEQTVGRYRRRWAAVLAGWWMSGGDRKPIYHRYDIREIQKTRPDLVPHRRSRQ